MTWDTFAPQSPFYLFAPYNLDLWAEYETGWKITDALPVNSVGIVTGQDKKAIAFSVDEAQELAVKHNLKKDVIQTIYYRPFDIRYITYDSSVVTRQRYEVMQHILPELNNTALITSRMTKGETFQHTQVTQCITEVICMSPKTSNNGFVFPIYLYPEKKEGELFSLDDDGSAWPLSDKGRRPNLDKKFVQDMADKLGLTFITDGKGDLQSTFGPEDIFAYAYAVFHSPAYRDRYAEFLKIDFPRLPLTSDLELFRVLVEKGAALVDLHLMKSPALGRLMTTYPADGDNQVERGYPKYTDENQRVWINKAQYFEGIPPEVWAFHVGGYQVLDKWLKDRRGRVLSYDDIRHYQRVVVALRETMRLMDEIDEAIPAWPLA